MIDPVSAVVVLGSLGAGWLLGRHARLKRTPTSTQPQPICLCEHHYGTHDPKTGACEASFVTDRHDSRRGLWQERVSCACVRYTGPQPIEQYWVPPAADMHIVTAPRPEVER